MPLTVACLLLSPLWARHGWAQERESFVFSPEGCEFAVEFRGPPELGTMEHEKGGVTFKAAYTDESAGIFHEANCTPASEQGLKGLRSEEGLRALLEVMGKEGQPKSESYDVDVETTDLGTVGHLRTVTLINGIAVVSESVFYVGWVSTMNVAAGSWAWVFPQPEDTAFLNSVTRSAGE